MHTSCCSLQSGRYTRASHVLLDRLDWHLAPVEDAGCQSRGGLSGGKHLREVLRHAGAAAGNDGDGDGRGHGTHELEVKALREIVGREELGWDPMADKGT